MRINKGTYTTVDIDLSNFDFTGVEKVVMTVKNGLGQPPVFTREFTYAAAFQILIAPEEAEQLTRGARYDMDAILTNQQRVPVAQPAIIELREGTGNVRDNSST